MGRVQTYGGEGRDILTSELEMEEGERKEDQNQRGGISAESRGSSKMKIKLNDSETPGWFGG